jgi:hypothetical protein
MRDYIVSYNRTSKKAVIHSSEQQAKDMQVVYAVVLAESEEVAKRRVEDAARQEQQVKKQ